MIKSPTCRVRVPLQQPSQLILEHLSLSLKFTGHQEGHCLESECSLAHSGIPVDHVHHQDAAARIGLFSGHCALARHPHALGTRLQSGPRRVDLREGLHLLGRLLSLALTSGQL